MNHRQPPLTLGWARRALDRRVFLILAMVPGISLAGVHGHPALSDCPCPYEPVVEPYLTHVGAPALRFQPQIQVAVLHDSPTSALAKNLGSHPPEMDIIPDPSLQTANLDKSADVSSGEAKPDPLANPKGRSSAPILPDDARPTVRPEDFLPFFQYPGSGSKSGAVIITNPVSLTPAVPGTLPPSSATYIQR
jgi:hypothetical protein